MAKFTSELSGSLLFKKNGILHSGFTPGDDRISVTGSMYVESGSLFVGNKSIDGRLDLLETQIQTSESIGGLNAHTGSTDVRLDSLQAQTGSYLVTASFDKFVSREVVATKKDGTTFSFAIDYATSASFASTASYVDITDIQGNAGLVSSSKQITDFGFISQSIWENIVNVPVDIVSSSNQLESDISGSFTSLSSSFEARITANSGSDWTDITNVPQDIVSSSNQLASDISGSIVATSASIANDIARVYSKGFITGSELDMKGNRVLFGNVYDFVGDLPSATDYHGMFAHVHITGEAYYAHAGQWVKLANSGSTADRLNAIENFSASLDSSFATDAELNASSSALTTAFTDADTTLSSSLATALTTEYTNADISLSSSLATALTNEYTAADTAISLSLANSIDDNGFRLDALEGKRLISSSNQLDGDISGSFTLVSASLAERITANSGSDWSDITNLPQDIVSSSIQLGSDISGSFTSTSASIAVDITDKDTRLTTLEGKTLVSSSIQIGSDISGSFTATSASIAIDITDKDTRLSTLEGRTLVSSSIQIGSDISGSFTSLSGSFAARITANSGSDWSDITNLPEDIVSSSLQLGSDISGSFTALSSSFEARITANSGSDWSDITNLPQDIVSSSLQLASDISGSFTSTSSSIAEDIASLIVDSASFEARITANSGSDWTNITNVPQDIVSSSLQLASDISGSFTSTSASIAEDITQATASISSNSSSIAQLLNFSSSLNNDFATDAELNASSSTLQTNIDNASSSLARDLSYATASITDLVAKTLVSSSIFTTSTQGTLSASINGNVTVLDLGLETTDSPTFASVTAEDFIGDLNGAVRFEAKNSSGGDLLEGRAIRVTGISGNTPEVEYANASASSGMPAFGLVRTDILNGATGEIITFGDLKGVNTSAFNLGDTLYIGTGSDGVLTNTPPTGSAFIQNIGKVTRFHSNNGTIKVGGAGRSAATPNLQTGQVFYGVGDRSVATDFTTLVADNGVEYSDILNKPTLVSQSNQIEADITGSFTSVSSSITDRLDNIEFVTEGKDITSGSTIVTNTTQGQVAVTHNLNSSSFKTINGLGVTGNPTFNNISASNDIYVANNLYVGATASIAYLEASYTNTVNVGDNKILLNIDTPTVRFGGLQIIDSGSLHETSSFLWDGQEHDFVYDYGVIGGDHEAGVFLAGPEMANHTQTVGRYPTNNEVQMGTGTHHLTGSKFYISNGHLSGSAFSGSFFGDGTNITNINPSSLPAGLLSSSIQIGTDISGSFTKASQSLASRIDVFEDATVLSSSLQIASEISGSFTSDSASFARRATWSTSSIERNETAIANLNSSGLLSSSIQIGSDISGSFTLLSSSFEVRITDKDTRLNTLESKTLVSSSNQLASDISGSNTAFSSSIASRVSLGLVTASTAANVLTLTKENGETFSLSIAQSGSIESASHAAFAISASNSNWGGLNNKPLDLVSSSLQLSSDISGSFVSTSASLASDITTNDTRLTSLEGKTLVSSSNQIASDISGSFTLLSSSFEVRITDKDTRLNTLEGKTLLSSSNQIASDISGSVTSLSASIATRFDGLTSDYNELQNVPAGIVSSSLQLASDISGSFTSTSASIATDITTNDSRLDTLEGKTLVSSSNQLASDISGSFTSTSASLAAAIAANSGSSWNNLTDVPQDIVSSSIQLASDISGSFTATSASIAIDITDKNTRLNTIEGKTLVSSSNQIASDISGSFTSTSASIAVDITANSSSAAALATFTSSYAVKDQTNHFTADQVITGSLTVTETLTVQTLVNEVTQSFILYSSGSTKFGDSNDDNHAFTGSIELVGGTISGSHIGDGSGLTGLTADSVTWSNITSKPQDIVSSSLQLASDISGSFTSDSSSFASRIDIFEDSELISSSIQIGSDISGSFTAVSNSFENRVTDNKNAIENINIFTSSIATTASNAFNGNQIITGSLEVTTGLYLNKQSSSITFEETPSTATTSAVIATVDTNTYNAAWFDYYLYKGSNHRAGTVTAVTDGSTYQWNDVSTLDIGDTAEAQTNVILNGTDLEFKLTSSTTGWTIKTIVKTL